MQIPAVIIADKIGRKKSIVLGNVSLIVFLVLLMKLPGAVRSCDCRCISCVWVFD